MTKRALIYIRLSSFTGADDSTTSPQRQKEVCQQFVLATGWTVVDVKEDLDVSGSDKGLRLDRPGLVYIRSRWDDIDAIVFSKLDRLARNTLDFLKFAEEAKEHGVALVSVSEGLDLSTGAGRMMSTMLASFAELEADAISARVKASILPRKLMGRYVGGSPVYGYDRAKDPQGPGTVLVVNPEQAAVVQEMATRVIAGESVYSIANDLSDRGILTRKGRRWDGKNVRSLLGTESLLGRIVHQGQVLRDEASGLPIQMWDPILDLDTAQKVRAKIEVKAKRARKRTARLLSGLLLCDLCEQNLYVNGSGQNYTYSCPGKTNGKNCTGTAVSCLRIEDFITQEFLAQRGSLMVYELSETPQLQVEQAELERAINETTDSMRSQGADIASLAERLQALKSAQTELSKKPRTRAAVRSTGQTYRQAWEASDVVQVRRDLLSKAIVGIYLKKGLKGRTGPFQAERADIQWNKIKIFVGGETDYEVEWTLDPTNVGSNMGVNIDDLRPGRVRLFLPASNRAGRKELEY